MISEQIYTSISLGEAVVAIEPIASVEELERSAHSADLAAVEGFTSPSRRAEGLAWRRLARRLYADLLSEAQLLSGEVEIIFSYGPSGVPRLTLETSGQPSQQENSFINKYRYISVSHCRDMVAVIISPRPCGVDVERVERNFERVAKRYISPDEEYLCASSYQKAILWCAKEAAYKIGGREGCNFVSDIVVTRIEHSQPSALELGVVGTLTLRCYDLPEMQMQIFAPTPNHILVVG